MNLPRPPPEIHGCDKRATDTQRLHRTFVALDTARIGESEERIGPGLTADIVYLRPAHRPPLLGTLAELGVFVREAPAFSPHDRIASAEIVIAMADSSERSCEAVRSLAQNGATVIAIVDDPRSDPPMRLAGASAVISESANPAALRHVLNSTGRTARERRASTGQPFSKVFGHLEFRASPPELAAGTRVAPLSPVEFEVMKLLARFRGEVVPRQALHACLSRKADEVSDGYLKTVVLRIRRKAGALGGDPGVLHAVRGMGYILRG